VSVQPDELAQAGRDAWQVVAGYLAATAIFGGIVALFYYPGRIGPAAIVVGLIAAGIGSSMRRFTGIAVAVAGLGWFFGMIIAIFLDRPIF
jgi:hypothetical protein